jgi:hypothetical protein
MNGPVSTRTRHPRAEAEPREFGLRQPVPGVAGFDEHADQVVGRCLPLLRDQVGRPRPGDHVVERAVDDARHFRAERLHSLFRESARD